MSGRCASDGCPKQSAGTGRYCSAHYYRKRRGLDMSAPFRGWRSDPEAMFWSKVQKSEGCWEWTAYRDHKGYGRYRGHLVHRFSYELIRGPIPDGLLLDHTCWNRACVNPDHLRPVTAHQNQQNRAGANSGSKSGIRGVSWDNRAKGWRAECSANGRAYHLGIFATTQEAETVVTEWRRTHMPYSLMDQRKAE